MLTPRFELTQSNEEVVISIYARYANIKDTEVYVEGKDFRFYSSPYYLRLKLPGEIIENDESKGSYDCETGTFTLKFSKVNKGEHFENLDMITTLLAPPKEKQDVVPTIEVIGNPTAQDDDGVVPLVNDLNDEDNEGNDDDWYIPQNPIASTASNILENAPKYGFANKISSALISFDAGWLRDVVDLPNPDSIPMSQRKQLQEADEKDHFSDDHYMADLVQADETVKPCIFFEPDWYKLKSETIDLTNREKDILKELPNKEFLLDNEEKQTVLYSLIDILFASCYNYRVTMGENSSESSWDINKISGTLSWFRNYSSLEDVIKTSIRRSLCYPLYRHWDLSMKVFEDVKQIMKLGKKMILKRFCEIYELFNNSFEPRYILNQFYIRDYLIWLQQVSDSLILSLYNALDSLTPKKEDMGLDLVELEAAAWSVLEEDNEIVQIDIGSSPEEQNLIIENSIHDIVNKFDKIVIERDNSCTEDSEDDSDTDSDTNSSSSMTSSTCSTSSTDSTSSSDSTSSLGHKKSPLILEMKKKIEDLDSDDCTDSEH